MNKEGLQDQAKRIKLLALDVDGVLSDGKIYYDNDGIETKTFSILDGLGIKLLQRSDIDVAIITGRRSRIVEQRAKELGITHLSQGREDKLVALQALSEELNVSLDHIAYMGDDLPDLPAIIKAGLGITVPNGHWFVRKHADYCCTAQGGHGAVREVCDLILEAQGKLDHLLEQYLPD